MGGVGSSCEPRRVGMEEIHGQTSEQRRAALSESREAEEMCSPRKQNVDVLASVQKSVVSAVSPRPQVSFEDEGTGGNKQLQWDVVALCQCSEPERQQPQMVEQQGISQKREDPRREARDIRQMMQPPLPSTRAVDSGEGHNGDWGQKQKPPNNPEMKGAIEIASEIRKLKKEQEKLSTERTYGWKKAWHSADALKRSLKTQLDELREHQEAEAKRESPPVKFSMSQKIRDESGLGNGPAAKTTTAKPQDTRRKSWSQAAMFKDSKKTQARSSS